MLAADPTDPLDWDLDMVFYRERPESSGKRDEFWIPQQNSSPSMTPSPLLPMMHPSVICSPGQRWPLDHVYFSNESCCTVHFDSFLPEPALRSLAVWTKGLVCWAAPVKPAFPKYKYILKGNSKKEMKHLKKTNPEYLTVLTDGFAVHIHFLAHVCLPILA